VPLARLAFTFLATIWVVLLATAPAAALGAPLAGLTYAFGSLLCHQRPDRSFHVGLSQLPVCARCLGLYVGAAAGALGLIILSRVGQRGFMAWTRTDVRRMLVAGALPTAITWALEAAGLWAPANVTRFIAALPLGVAVALTVNYVECARPRRSESTLPPTPT
jgi:uncharacterized membrane protein